MTNYRFTVGTTILCNLGEHGWKLGRIIALDYRENKWPEGQVAPYQVALEENYTLIYVPEDNDRFCREITVEDQRILERKDALAGLKNEGKGAASATSRPSKDSNLCCPSESSAPKYQSYRKGRCFCCDDCPKDWSYAELYSEHYRCAERNNVEVTRQEFDLGTYEVGKLFDGEYKILSAKGGFMQAPTLVRLPPGIQFSDDGQLSGTLRYDPHRGTNYEVNFVAVSASDWSNSSVGLVRLEIRFRVENNLPPHGFDVSMFQKGQSKARSAAADLLENLNQTWGAWEINQLGNRDTCDRMLADLNQLRTLLESNPRLDNGKWWGHLGGYHMNVHKLLENTLFECELYLGYALTFGDDDVRFYAEQNLKGCYQKRLLEAARFMWYDGIELMMKGEWSSAVEVFQAAHAKKEGWGWAVNHGDIWLSEAVALMNEGAKIDSKDWIQSARVLLERARKRANESNVFGAQGHPWINEVGMALDSYNELISTGEDTGPWLDELGARTVYWCSQVRAGVFPFPPQPKERLAEESNLVNNLPGYNM